MKVVGEGWGSRRRETHPSGPPRALRGGTALLMSHVPSIPQPKSKPAMLTPTRSRELAIVFRSGLFSIASGTSCDEDLRYWNFPELFCLGTRYCEDCSCAVRVMGT